MNSRKSFSMMAPTHKCSTKDMDRAVKVAELLKLNDSDTSALECSRRSMISSLENNVNDVAEFKRSEIKAGELLGNGGFAQVYEVSRIKLRRWAIVRKAKAKSRRAKKEAVENGHLGLAIKHLRPSIFKGRRRVVDRALQCLILEAELLASLSHENIVKLHGVPSFGSEDASSGQCDDFFLLLEKVDTTLNLEIFLWKSLCDTESRGESLFVKKLDYALQLSKALAYMHERRIIYRDLKPQNVGLRGGTIKLFDFGLSRELPKTERDSVCEDDECFLMSFAGTPRYACPEMFTTRCYNLKADVYSWSMVFYEMLTLTKPYEMRDNEVLADFLFKLDERPVLDPASGIPYSVITLVYDSWDHSISRRPAMKDVCKELELIKLENSNKDKGSRLNKNTISNSKPENKIADNSPVICNSPHPLRRNSAVASAA